MCWLLLDPMHQHAAIYPSLSLIPILLIIATQFNYYVPYLSEFVYLITFVYLIQLYMIINVTAQTGTSEHGSKKLKSQNR
jgi:hypothetical protein